MLNANYEIKLSTDTAQFCKIHRIPRLGSRGHHSPAALHTSTIICVNYKIMRLDYYIVCINVSNARSNRVYSLLHECNIMSAWFGTYEHAKNRSIARYHHANADQHW